MFDILLFMYIIDYYTYTAENDIQRGKGEAAARAIQSLWNTLTMVSFSEFGPHLFQTHFINYDDYERAQKKSIHDVNKEVMINVLLKAKGAIQLNPELFQTFCDGLHLCTGGVACYEKVTGINLCKVTAYHSNVYVACLYS